MNENEGNSKPSILEYDPPTPCSLEVLPFTPDELVIIKITMCKSLKYQPLFFFSLIVQRQTESLGSPCCSSRFQLFLRWKRQATASHTLLMTMFYVYELLTC